MADQSLEAPARAASANKFTLFVTAVLACTLIPYIFMPLNALALPGFESFVLFAGFLMFIGGDAHVASSFLFYTLPEARPLIRDNPKRYIAVPIALILGSGVLIALGPPVVDKHYFLFLLAWLLWHYQRQNFGIASFFAAKTRTGPLSRRERYLINGAAVCGIVGLIKVNGAADMTLFEPLVEEVRLLGKYAYMAILAVSVATFGENLLKGAKLKGIAVLAATLFFLPTYLFSNPVAAFAGYALAHGLQYLVFMSVVATSHTRASIGRNLGILVACVAAGGYFLTFLRETGPGDGPFNGLLFGIAVGIVMSHFVVDAGIWKLRNAQSRAFVKDKFGFIFE